MAHEPVCEMGVVSLFSMLAERLGFVIVRVGRGYPDCEAVRCSGARLWTRVLIEFEFDSVNFKLHGHDADLCDVIVCWQHTWAACPKRIEVIELRQVVRGRGTRET